VSAFANCGRAVAHVRGSYGPGRRDSRTGADGISICWSGVGDTRTGWTGR